MKPPIGYLFKQIHIKCEKKINQHLASENLTSAQLSLMSYLLDHKSEKITQKDIAEELEIKHTTVIGLVRRLEEKELVRSVTDPDNRKYRNISLTSKAMKVEEMIRTHRRTMDEALSKGLTDEEVEQLRILLQKVRNNLD